MRVSRPHYAYLVVALIFFALLAAAGLRSTPAVLLVPWANAFHWSRSVISFAAAVRHFSVTALPVLSRRRRCSVSASARRCCSRWP